jgi:hypothetical protein
MVSASRTRPDACRLVRRAANSVNHNSIWHFPSYFERVAVVSRLDMVDMRPRCGLRAIHFRGDCSLDVADSA